MNANILNQWTIEPPHGCRFANQLGGEVTLFFPRGSEKAIRDYVIRAVNEAYKRSLTVPVFAPPPPAAGPQPTHTPNATPTAAPHGMVPRTRTVKMQDGSEATITEYVPTSQGPHLAPAPPAAPVAHAGTRVVKMPDGSEATITEAPAQGYSGARIVDNVSAYPMLPINAHPLDRLAAGTGAHAAHAEQPTFAPLAPPQGDELDVEALLAEPADTVPPPANLTQCAYLHAVDADHVVQCSLAPHASGMHAIKHEGAFYPLNLAPRETWKTIGA